MSASKLKEIAGYKFTRPSLLDEALSHPSLAGKINYQRLEFLGDRVLALIISTWLLDEYPNEQEGKLNARFTALVRRETLAAVSREAGFVPHIKMAHGAETEDTRNKEAVQSDICEAIIGAMYLDGGIEPVKLFLDKYLRGKLKEGFGATKDYKTQLQEWAQGRAHPLPTYEMVGRSGPDHTPVFTIEVKVGDIGSASGTGTNKRTAEQSAAQTLLNELKSSS